MYYVGVDIAKRSHYAAAHDESGAVVVSPFPFDNTSQGFAKLLLDLRRMAVRSHAVSLYIFIDLAEQVIHLCAPPRPGGS